jgi:hypothetical protein
MPVEMLEDMPSIALIVLNWRCSIDKNSRHFSILSCNWFKRPLMFDCIDLIENVSPIEHKIPATDVRNLMDATVSKFLTELNTPSMSLPALLIAVAVS